jgi:hypothetical protein
MISLIAPTVGRGKAWQILLATSHHAWAVQDGFEGKSVHSRLVYKFEES